MVFLFSYKLCIESYELTMSYKTKNTKLCKHKNKSISESFAIYLTLIYLLLLKFLIYFFS